MSDYTAIAGVSRTLRELLRVRMQVVPDNLTIVPPDVEVQDINGNRLNLYLFQVSEDVSLKNQEIPGLGYPGAYGHPPLSLELYYLLTAYSASEDGTTDSDLEAQSILGDAMQVLHDFAIIIDDDPILDSALQGEFERIKITLQPMTLEDLSKLWTALPQANFRRSVVYHVSVIQIESRRERRYPRLVAEPPPEGPPPGPMVYAVAFRSPRIDELRVIRQGDPDLTERPYPYARIGDTLVLRGLNFSGDTTRVLVGDVDATTEIVTLQNDRIELTIPDDVALQPGTQPIQVVLDVMMGDPPSARAGFQSNLCVFMLVPRITSIIEDLGSIPRTLQLNGTRLFNPDLRCLTLVGDEVISSADYTTADPTQIELNLPATLGTGDYAVRVRVNGAESIDEVILTIPP